MFNVTTNSPVLVDVHVSHLQDAMWQHTDSLSPRMDSVTKPAICMSANTHTWTRVVLMSNKKTLRNLVVPTRIVFHHGNGIAMNQEGKALFHEGCHAMYDRLARKRLMVYKKKW